MNNRYRLYIIIWLAGALLPVSTADLWESTLAQTITPIPSTVHLPVIMNPPIPTATPIPTEFSCPAIPLSLPSGVPDSPVKIVSIDKRAESVQLQNVSGESVDLSGWHMCSVRGTQEHRPITSILAPSETASYVNNTGDNVWHNTARDDGALYNADGQLVSYWVDPG